VFFTFHFSLKILTDLKNVEMKKILFPFIFCASLVGASTLVESCYYDKESELYPTSSTSTCDTTTAKFATFVAPLIASGCATSGCHSTASKAAGINLGTYADTKAYIVANKAVFIGSIEHTAGYSKMPKSGGKFAACDITKLKAWINAGALNN
jgi:hypothetical protein